VQDIVSEAGVPTRTFYNYFEGKEALAIAASDVLYARFLSLLVLEASTSPSGRLRQLFHTILKELKRFDDLRDCLVASAITNATPALTKRVAEHLDDVTWRMSVVIEPGQNAGEIKADTPRMDQRGSC
jgi:AcrR family transcriptional regulator